MKDRKKTLADLQDDAVMDSGVSGEVGAADLESYVGTGHYGGVVLGERGSKGERGE